MKAVDLRKLNADELADRVREARDQLFQLKIQHSTGQLEKATGLRTARRDLARALTVQKQAKDSA